jgi:two-component system, response regulator PdtaR
MKAHRPATVLVVEDDPLVRSMMVDVLLEAGFDTCEAGCAKEALDVFAEHRIDAVVTDVDMPGEVDGIALARRIGELWPAVGVIVASGRPPRALPPGAWFIAKPFAARHLLQCVADLTGPRANL